VAFNERSLDDYVDVAQRIADFREAYPSGSLQPADPAMPYHVVRVPSGWCRQCIGRRSVKAGRDSWKTCPRCQGSGVRADGEPTEDIFIVYAAAAYRTPDDLRPGVGMAWEPFPGQTPYTGQSELMNAETSAWGRAIVAVLASDSKAGMASRQEVKARRMERDDGLPTNRDGSLSRSRTTDEEKDAAGVMTSAQLAEHTALQPKRAEQGGTVTRLPSTPPDDPWLDQPAGSLAADLAASLEDRPGTITPQQQRAIMARMGGPTEDRAKQRLDRLAEISRIVGRTVGSTNELSFTEAQRVLAEAGKAAAK
jgi:hypothetical protein